MAATPKRKMSASRKKRRLAHQYKAKLPQLTKTAAGKWLPAHTVTPEQPMHKGTRFLAVKTKKQA